MAKPSPKPEEHGFPNSQDKKVLFWFFAILNGGFLLFVNCMLQASDTEQVMDRSVSPGGRLVCVVEYERREGDPTPVSLSVFERKNGLNDQLLMRRYLGDCPVGTINCLHVEWTAATRLTVFLQDSTRNDSEPNPKQLPILHYDQTEGTTVLMTVSEAIEELEPEEENSQRDESGHRQLVPVR